MSKNLLANNKLNLAGIDHIQAGIFDINGLMRGKRFQTSSYDEIIAFSATYQTRCAWFFCNYPLT
tara:strand:+ start:430 stop:624 length:195 start_codon:yes stop_codon:yes gene_type:complete